MRTRVGRRRFVELLGLAAVAPYRLLASLMSSPSITVTPSIAAPGDNVRVDGKGFDPRIKFALATSDRDGVEVGASTNKNRPARDGTFHVGIYVPPKMPCLVQAYQGTALVACAPVQVKR